MRLLLLALLFLLPLTAFSQEEIQLNFSDVQTTQARRFNNENFRFVTDNSRPFHWRSFKFFSELPEFLLRDPNEQFVIAEAIKRNSRVVIRNMSGDRDISIEDVRMLIEYISQPDIYNYNFEKLTEFLALRFSDQQKETPNYLDISRNLRAAYEAIKFSDLRQRTETSFHYDAALIYLKNLRAFNTMNAKPNTPSEDEILMDLLASLKANNFRRSMLRELVTTLISKQSNDLDSILSARFKNGMTGDSSVELIIDILNDTTKMTTFISPELRELELLCARQIYILEHMYREETNLDTKMVIGQRILRMNDKVFNFMEFRKSKYSRRFEKIGMKYTNELENLRPKPTAEEKLRTEKIRLNSEFESFAAAAAGNSSRNLTYGDSVIVFIKEQLEVTFPRTGKIVPILKPAPKTLQVVTAYREINGEVAYTFNEFFSLVDSNKEIDGLYITKPYEGKLPLNYAQLEIAPSLYLLVKIEHLDKKSITLEQIQNKTAVLTRINPIINIQYMITENTPFVASKQTEAILPPPPPRPVVYVIPESRYLRFCQALFK